jgi:hypothetical protein
VISENENENNSPPWPMLRQIDAVAVVFESSTGHA